MYKNILVPTDGSKLSKKAVVGAVQLAKATGARLVALHVYPKFSGSPYGSFGPPDEVIAAAHAMQHRTEAKKIFAGIRMLAGTHGIGLDTVLVESDNVHKEIIAAARKGKCDLVCMASHGRRGLSGLLLGSETQKVLIHSSTPVLVLR